MPTATTTAGQSREFENEKWTLRNAVLWSFGRGGVTTLRFGMTGRGHWVHWKGLQRWSWPPVGPQILFTAPGLGIMQQRLSDGITHTLR